jgi:hypothetical protein
MAVPSRDPAYLRKYYADYRVKNRERIKAFPSSSTEARRAWRFKNKYGISVDDYDVMLKRQGGVCAICRDPPSGRYKRLDVDHCHSTGRVRGLLCHQCNTAIGLLKDDPEIIKNVAVYIAAG